MQVALLTSCLVAFATAVKAESVTASSYFGSVYGAVSNTTTNGVSFLNAQDNFTRAYGTIAINGSDNAFTVVFTDPSGGTGTASFTVQDSGYGNNGNALSQFGNGLLVANNTGESLTLTLESLSGSVSSLLLDAIGVETYTMGSNLFYAVLPDGSTYTTEAASGIGVAWNVGETLSIGGVGGSGGYRLAGIQLSADVQTVAGVIPFPSYTTKAKSGEISATVVDDVLGLSASSVDQLREAFVEIAMENIDAGYNSASNLGIQFDVKGVTPDGFAALCVRSDVVKNSFTRAYQAIFPVSGDWQTVTLYWEDFVYNIKPWTDAEDGLLSVGNQRVDISQMQTVAWGRNYALHGSRTHTHWSNDSDWALSLKNISFVTSDRLDPAPATFSKDLSRSIGKLYNGEGLNILLLGDSITDYGRSEPHAHYLAQKLNSLYGVTCNIFNAGVGGQSIRAGTIIFPRSIKEMRASIGEPDLIVMFYGANDCKAAPLVGLSASDFQGHIETMIDQVRIETNGNADILLVTGVPRVDSAYTASTGKVEAVADGITWAASAKETALVDSLSAYLGLDTGLWPGYYKDTIHQDPLGLEFLGTLMYEEFLVGDADDDGVCNLLETAMRSAPSDNQVYASSSVRVVDSDGQKTVEFSYPRNLDFDTLNYSVYYSGNMANWTRYNGVLSSSDIDENTQLVTASLDAVEEPTFFILQVDAP